MRTITRLLFISMLLSTAVPSMLFSSERESTEHNISRLSEDSPISKRTPLELAFSKESNLGIVELLLKNHADANAKSSSYTPLRWAASRNDLGVTELLLQYNADVGDKSSDDGCSVLQFCGRSNDVKIAKLIIENNPKNWKYLKK